MKCDDEKVNDDLAISFTYDMILLILSSSVIVIVSIISRAY